MLLEAKGRKYELIIEVTIFYWHSVCTYLHSAFSVNGSHSRYKSKWIFIFHNRKRKRSQHLTEIINLYENSWLPIWHLWFPPSLIYSTIHGSNTVCKEIFNISRLLVLSSSISIVFYSMTWRKRLQNSQKDWVSPISREKRQ